MTTTVPVRRIAAAIAVLAGLIATTATASAAGQRHDLKLYKVERQVSMSTADLSADVSCEAGDYALDGMWRVDAVDGAALSSVSVPRAHGDAADPATYRFRFTKAVPGQAQLKLFVTCLGSVTAPGAHQHTFTISAQRTAAFAGGPGVGAGFQPGANACASGQIAVSPGYAFTSGAGHVAGSRASLSSEPDPLRNWAMAFWLDGPSTWTTSMRCLTLQSSSSGGHTHEIEVSVIGDPQVFDLIGPGAVAELRVSCGQQAKGLLAGFDTLPEFAQQDWFLGMDPRIKTRAVKFLNTGATPMSVWTGLTCFKDRTTKAL